MDRKEDWPISGINISVSKIEILNKDKENISCATGFFFRHNNKKYLISNRHVVIDEDDGFFPQFIKLKLHTSRTHFEQNVSLYIRLYQGSNKNWIEHPDYNEKQIDVVAIPLDEITVENILNLNRSLINFFTIENFNDEYKISSFSDVLIIGYPLGFSDDINNLPVYRKGMIASSYPVEFEKHPCFLIDSNLHEGTSGSPVLNSPNNMLTDSQGRGLHSNKSLLLGIHSAEHIVEEEPLGLCVVWYPRVITEIIEHEE